MKMFLIAGKNNKLNQQKLLKKKIVSQRLE